MKIAIVGSSGYIAKHLMDVIAAELPECDVVKIDKTNEADLKLQLTDPSAFDYDSLSNVDYVIFTAAISSPDQCSENFDYCWSVNVTGTCHFIQETLKRGVRVLFFSSDAVFGDIPGMVYDEKSETMAYTAYGKMKKAVEDRFLSCKGFKCIRLSYVVSSNDKFISYCIKCIENGQVADIFHPFYRNCITVADVCTSIMWLMKNWEDFPSFVLNLAGIELVSRVRMADELNRHLGNKLEYTISFPGEGFYNNRPKTTQMRSLYLYDLGILERKSFSEKIRYELLKK